MATPDEPVAELPDAPIAGDSLPDSPTPTHYDAGVDTGTRAEEYGRDAS